MFFLLKYSFFLGGRFWVRSRGSLPSAHFIYCLPCYSWLSIFYGVLDFIDLTLNAFKSLFLVCVSSPWAFVNFWMLAFVAQGLPLNEARIIHSWIFSMLFPDFKAFGRRSIPIPPMTVLIEFFLADTETNINPLSVE